MWKKILYTIFISGIFVGSVVSANYVFNPFTQRLDRTMDGEAPTFTTSTSATSTITGGFFQTGLTDCDLDTDAVNYDLSLGKFICGDDDTGAGGTNDWAVSSTYSSPALTTTSSINLWAKQSLYVSSTLLVDGLSTFTYVSSTGFSASYVSSTRYTSPGADTYILFNNMGDIGTDSHFYFNTTTNALHVHAISGDATDGLLVESENGTDVAVLGLANSANALFYGGVNIDGQTRLATSLTGLAYLSSGVVSAVTSFSFGNITGSNFFATNVSSTFTSSTYSSSTVATIGSLTVLSGLSLPNNSITDAMVANDITASNYLLLTGGTLTGGLSFTSMSGSNFFATNVSSTFASSTYTSTTALTAHAFFQNGLPDCSNENQTLNYTLSTGLFSCLTDGGGVGSSFDGFATFPYYTTNGTNTSTLRWDGLYIATSTSNMEGLFAVNSSGNVSASGTLRVFGLSTLNGFISSASSSISAGLQVSGVLNASSTLLIGGTTQVGVSTTAITNGGLEIGRNNTTFRRGLFWVDTTSGGNGNISTSGTLQTFGLSTFRAGFISNASSSIGGALTVSGRLTASTTAIFTRGLIGNASSSFGGALTISGRLTASTTSFFTQGLIGFTSSTFTGFLRAQNLSTSGSLYFGDNSVMTTGRYQMSKYYYYTSTTDFFLLGRAEVASTIRKCSVVLVCEESCRTETTRPGLQIDLFHGTSLAVLSSTTTVFTTSIYPNSTTTEQSFCASGCDITKTNSDVTLAVDEYLWMRVPSASTTQVSANIDCTLDHAS